MQVRIKFSADLIVTGCDIEEIRRKFEGMPLFSKQAQDCGVEFSEFLLIENADNYDDLWREYWDNLLTENTKKDDDDVRCPYCGSDEASFIDETNDYYCPNCHNSF